VIYKAAASILTEAKGFMGGYDYTLIHIQDVHLVVHIVYAAFFQGQRNKEKTGVIGFK